MDDEYAHLSTPHPDFAAALAKMKPSPPVTDILAFRASTAVAREGKPKVTYPESQVKIKDWTVPVKDGSIVVRMYLPQPSEGHTFPLLFWAHGGGYAVGALETDEDMLIHLAIDLRLSVASVEYRLAPEHPFPVGLNDTYEALKWASTHAGDLNADLTKGFLFGGISAGGNFVAVLTHRARDDPELRGRITGQILQVPHLIHLAGIPEKYKSELQSLEQIRETPILSRPFMELCMTAYQVPDPADPEMSPVLYPSHKDLPPAYLQISGLDPLRDEGLLYAKLLKKDGVKTKVDTYAGLPHAFHMYFPYPEPLAKWNKDIREGVQWLLAGGV